MSAKTTRRIGAIAGLALVPALLFGGTALATSADAQPTNPGQTQPADPSTGVHKIKVEGVVSKIAKQGDVTVIFIAAHPGGPELEFVLSPETVVELQNGAPGVGSKVTASGEVQQDGKTVLAEHMTFH